MDLKELERAVRKVVSGGESLGLAGLRTQRLLSPELAAAISTLSSKVDAGPSIGDDPVNWM